MGFADEAARLPCGSDAVLIQGSLRRHSPRNELETKGEAFISGPAATVPIAPTRRFEIKLRAARRHSRLVRVMRTGLPVLALAGLGGFAVLVWASNAIPDGLDVEALSVENGELVMTNPRLVGFDEREQPYSVDAERAMQNIANPDLFQLEEVLAEVPLADGRRVTVLSQRGAYDRGSERLTIPDPFTVMVDDGTVAEFANGEVDVAAGTMSSTGAVDIRGPDARIEAERMDIERAGRKATFSGGVVVTIEPGSRMAPPTLRNGGEPAAEEDNALRRSDEAPSRTEATTPNELTPIELSGPVPAPRRRGE